QQFLKIKEDNGMANNTAGSLPIFLSWAGKRVSIGEVDSTLSSLWKMSADNMRIGANLNVRTSVMNLIICTSDVESARYASQLLRDLSSIHLARATIVILDSSEGALDTMDSWVTLRCYSMISDLMRHCFEQTTLLSSGKTTRALHTTLPAMLKAHLPTYLWWIGDIQGTDDTIFRGVAEMCQRVIVDSATFFSPEQDIHALAHYCKTTPEAALSDLSWGRLIPWQQLVAQFFDVPEYLPFLTGVEKIEIEHAVAPLASPSKDKDGGVSPNPTSALLLSGWLKARLNLTQAHERAQDQRDTASGTYQWHMSQSSGNTSPIIQIRPHVQSALRPGSITLVRLTCQSAERRAVFTIKRDTDLDYVLTSVELADDTRPARTVNLPARYNESELLRNELEIMVHDHTFEQALQEIAGLLTG
ncbi:MAG TPA: glucose-6-phosphate dehydrogenase assembly protein OpcA, partial [Ktedonobacteraceae bacterium]|nr:glucose-6-phosphate dehydrogenase assembly protein OpcA [Ktedonobacteraceae bacterium]